MTHSKIPLTLIAGRAELRPLLPRLVASGHAVIAPPSLVDHRDPRPAGIIVPDEVSRSPGCSCCRVRLDLIEAVERAVRRAERPHRVVIAVDLDDDSGHDVVAAAYTVLSDVDLARLVQLDGVVVTYDAVSLATRVAVAEPNTRLLSPADAEAFAIADRVLFARSGTVLPNALDGVADQIRSAAPFAQIVTPAVRPVGPEALFGLDAWHRVPALPSELRPTPGGPDTVVLAQRGLMSADALDDWFDDLVTRNAQRLLRFQGVVSPDGEASRLCCVGVRSFAASHPESDHASPSSVESRVVLTGWELDAAALEESFRATLL